MPHSFFPYLLLARIHNRENLRDVPSFSSWEERSLHQRQHNHNTAINPARSTTRPARPGQLQCTVKSDISGNDCTSAIATTPHAAPSDPLDRVHNQIYAVGDEHKVWKVTATDPGGRWRPVPVTWRRVHRDPLNEYVAKRPPVQLHSDCSS